MRQWERRDTGERSTLSASSFSKAYRPMRRTTWWCSLVSLGLALSAGVAHAAPAKGSAKAPPKPPSKGKTTSTTTEEPSEGDLDEAYQEHVDDVGLDLSCSACAHTARSLKAKLFLKEKPKQTKRQKEKMMDSVLDVVCDDSDFPEKLVVSGEHPERQYVDAGLVATEKEFKVSRETIAKNVDKLVEVCETIVEQKAQLITDKVLGSKDTMASFNWEQELCVLDTFHCEKTLLHSDDEFTPEKAEAKRVAAEKKKAEEAKKKEARAKGEEYTPPDDDDEDDEDMAEIRKSKGKEGKRKSKPPAPAYCAPNDMRCQGNKPTRKPVPKKKPKKDALAKLITNVKERQAFISEVFEHELECWKMIAPTLTTAIPPAEKNLEVAWNGLLTCGRKNHPAFRTQNLPDCSPLTLLFGVHTISILAQRHSKLGSCCRTNSGELLWERPELHIGFTSKAEGEESGPGAFNPALLENRLMHMLHKLVFTIVEHMDIKEDDTYVSDTLSQHRGTGWQKDSDSADFHAKKAKCPDPWEEPSDEEDAGDDDDEEEDGDDDDDEEGDEEEDEGEEDAEL